MMFSVRSESEQISQEIAFVGLRQRRAVEVAFIAVADIARVCAERLETPIAALAEIVVGIAGELCPHVRPVDVGANLGERDNAEGARTVGSMTRGAVGREYDLAALDGRRVGLVRRG